MACTPFSSRAFRVMLVILAALTAMPDRARSAPEDVVIIKRMIDQIQKASPTRRPDGAESFTEKQFAANTLTNFIHHMDPSEREAVDPDTIDDIAALLSNQDHYVRYEAAAALGLIGAPAKRVVPALLHALKEARSREPRVSTGIGIEDVIVSELIRWNVCTPQPVILFSPACDYLLR